MSERHTRRGIITRKVKSGSERPQHERPIPPEIEQLTTQAILRSRDLGMQHGILTLYEVRGDPRIIGGAEVQETYTALEIPLVSGNYSYNVSITTVNRAGGNYIHVDSDFDQLGNPIKTVRDRSDRYTDPSKKEILHQGRLIYRRVKDRNNNRLIRDLEDSEAIELLKDVLTAQPDHNRIQQRYTARRAQLVRGENHLAAVSWAKPQ